jgi:hypothetical protein
MNASGLDRCSAEGIAVIRDRCSEISDTKVRVADNPAIWVPHIHHRVTNVYRRTLGHWKLVHHHTDSSEARMDIVKDLTEIEKRTAER